MDCVNNVRYYKEMFYVDMVSEEVTNISALLILRTNYP